MSASLKLQKRLAASVLKCGKGRVWLDPNEINEIGMANSRKNVRKLVKDGFIIKKPQGIHSHARHRKRIAAKKKGRHSGPGSRKGTREARTPSKRLWMRRIRILRRLLFKYRAQKKIDKHLYHELYMKVKGNVFKNKRVLMEYIFRVKNEKTRLKNLEEQAAALKNKGRLAREKRAQKALDKHRILAEDELKDQSGKGVKQKAVQKQKAGNKKDAAPKKVPNTQRKAELAKKAEKKAEPKKAAEPAKKAPEPAKKASEPKKAAEPKKTSTAPTKKADQPAVTKKSAETKKAPAPAATADKKTGGGNKKSGGAAKKQ